MSDFSEFVRSLQGRQVLHLMHRDADCDALGAAFALSTVIPGELGVYGELKTSARDLAQALRLEINHTPDVSACDYVVIVDTLSPDLVGGPLPARFALIDHHAADGPRSGSFINTLAPLAERVWLEPLEAACAVVWELIRAAGLPVSRGAGLALLAGIVTDTAWLTIAPPDCFRRLAAIMAHTGLALEDVYRAIDGDLRRKTRRRAVLRALRDLHEREFGDFSVLAAITDSHDHGFALGSALGRLGADVRVVAFPKDGQTLILADASMEVAERADLDLGQTFQQLAGPLCASQCWGSRLLGRLLAPGSAETLLNACVDAIGAELE